MSADATLGYRRARRAYELGRLRSSLLRGLAVTTLIGLLGWGTSGVASLKLLPLTLGIWLFVHWLGQSYQRGALYGLVGGVVTHLLPMSILRPCCDMDA